MTTRTVRAVVPAVLLGLLATVVALAPSSRAAPVTTIVFDDGCSEATLARGATFDASETRVYLLGQQSALTPGHVYTFLWQGPGPTGHATLGTADAHGVLTISHLTIDLSGSPVPTSATYAVHDATAGGTDRTGTAPFLTRAADDCRVLGTLSAIRSLDPSGFNAFTLKQQSDGNVVERNGQGRVLWALGTAGHPGAHAIMQSDGNLVVRDAAGRPLWATNTAGHPNATLTLQTDDNVVLRDVAGRALWSTGIH